MGCTEDEYNLEDFDFSDNDPLINQLNQKEKEKQEKLLKKNKNKKKKKLKVKVKIKLLFQIKLHQINLPKMKKL